MTCVSVGQEPAESPAPVAEVPQPGLTVDLIEQRLQLVSQDTTLSEDQRAAVSEVYRAAIADLKGVQELVRRGEALAAEAESASARAEAIRTKRDELKAKQPTVDDQLTLIELEQRHAQLELQLANQKQSRQNAESESQLRSQRRKEIRTRIASLRQQIDTLITTNKADANVDKSPLVIARRTHAATTVHLLESELPALEAELTKYDAEEAVGMVQLRSDLAAKTIGFSEKSLELVAARIKTARELAAAESVRKARLEAIDAAPSLRAHAEANHDLAESAKQISDSLATAEKDLKAASEAHEQLARQFKQTRAKVESVGLTSSVGALLRKQRSTLPDVGERRSAVAARQSVINEAQYDLFEYDDQRQEVADTNGT